MSYSTPAIVVGGEANALGVIRNLGRLDIPVYCLIDSTEAYAIYSRYSEGYYFASRIESDPNVMHEALSRISSHFSDSVYVHPTSDLSVLHLASIIDELPQCVASIPSQPTAEILVNKIQFYKSLQESAIPHPVTMIFGDQDIEEITHSLSFPVFIKPGISQTFVQQFRRKGFIAHNSQEYRRYLEMVTRNGIDVIVQEIVLGPDTNHYGIIGYMDKQSQVKVAFAIHILRQPSFFAVCSAFKSIPQKRIKPLINLTVKYLQSIHYHGLFGAEWKQDTKDGVFKLLEINARSCTFNTHQTMSGVNLILMAYREAIGEHIARNMEYETEIYAIDVLSDLKAIAKKFLHRQLSVRQVLSSYLKKHDWLLYARDDPLPFLQHLRKIQNPHA